MANPLEGQSFARMGTIYHNFCEMVDSLEATGKALSADSDTAATGKADNVAFCCRGWSVQGVPAVRQVTYRFLAEAFVDFDARFRSPGMYRSVPRHFGEPQRQP